MALMRTTSYRYDSIIVSPHSDSEREARPQNVDKIVQIMTFEFL
jgi:hypothetical protein